MKTPMPALTAAQQSRLRHAMQDTRNHSVSVYAILADAGMMERTANGFRAIDPEQVNRRCAELLARPTVSISSVQNCAALARAVLSAAKQTH